MQQLTIPNMPDIAERMSKDSADTASFEERLGRDSRWALTEGSIFFEGRGAVQQTLRKITKRLGDLGIPYAVVGGMALFHHGLRRFTEDVDLLVTADGLREIHRQLEGLGYLPPFTNSKHLRDTDTGVKIEFLVTGGYPGDGQPKPVAFPDPATVAIEKDDIRYVNLPTLVELKLASGMTNPQRAKDLIDVQELIRILRLTEEFGRMLNPYVRDKYADLHRTAHAGVARYLKNAADAGSLLDAMISDGVAVDGNYLVTTDPVLAHKYDMHEESEFLKES